MQDINEFSKVDNLIGKMLQKNNKTFSNQTKCQHICGKENDLTLNNHPRIDSYINPP